MLSKLVPIISITVIGANVLIGHADAKPQLVFQNKCPQPQDIAYNQAVETLRVALREGRKVRVYMQREVGATKEEYVTDLVAIRFDEAVINALLPLRPFLDAHAQNVAANGFFGGSIDTLGNYWYSPYRLGADTIAKSSTDQSFGAINDGSCFLIQWFADD